MGGWGLGREEGGETAVGIQKLTNQLKVDAYAYKIIYTHVKGRLYYLILINFIKVFHCAQRFEWENIWEIGD